jgi:hypothetical protein
MALTYQLFHGWIDEIRAGIRTEREVGKITENLRGARGVWKRPSTTSYRSQCFVNFFSRVTTSIADVGSSEFYKHICFRSRTPEYIVGMIAQYIVGQEKGSQSGLKWGLLLCTRPKTYESSVRAVFTQVSCPDCFYSHIDAVLLGWTCPLKDYDLSHEIFRWLVLFESTSIQREHLPTGHWVRAPEWNRW